MLLFYKRVRKNRTAGRPPRLSDPALTFTPREWADLPPHHPPVERE